MAFLLFENLSVNMYPLYSSIKKIPKWNKISCVSVVHYILLASCILLLRKYMLRVISGTAVAIKYVR